MMECNVYEKLLKLSHKNRENPNMKLNKYIDHTLLKQDASQEQINRLLSEAREYDFASVCVNPTWVKHAKTGLKGSDVKVCTVVGFPLGATTSAVKTFETKEAIQNLA